MSYEGAIAAAERDGEATMLAEALRRLAILRHQRDEFGPSRVLCRRSYEVALEAGNDLLAAEALNTMGVQDLTSGTLEDAQDHFLRAFELGGHSLELQARIEQNLGILANIRGNLAEASERYGRSLAAYQECDNAHGCALVYCNMGMVSADLEQFDDAERYLGESLSIAERAGDQHLQGLCLVNQAEVDVARQRFEDARRRAEAALALFDQLGARSAKSDAYRVIGMVYRDTGRPALAESRLKSALDMATTSGSSLNEAEALRELALLYQDMGRNIEALTHLNVSHRLFSRMDAQADLINVAGRVERLESTYKAVVREWGQSIESADSYTFGHCERVAEHAVAVALALGLDGAAQTAIRLGAYLHDVGKVKVAHEILNKPGPLTREEYEVVQLHPVWGVELVADVEFPWDLKPVIRWHHERYDGTGYPDRLRGDEIPVSAQVVGIVDMYDALTTTRSYRAAMSHVEAMAEITKCRAWWSPAVFEAFVTASGPGPVPVSVAAVAAGCPVSS